MKDELLLRYLNKYCSTDEIQQVYEWLAESEEHRTHFFELEQLWALKAEMNFSNSQRMELAYQQLSTRLKLKKTPSKFGLRFITQHWMKYAALLVIAFLLTINFVFISKEEPIAYNTVMVPKGQRVSLLLSDGTTVWLNAESKFSYPTKFSPKDRRVKLEGEGYFEVAHDASSPFTVELQMLNVHVLGTKFNVTAYRNEPCWVTLKEGKVEVATIDHTKRETLLPNDQAYYSAQSGLVLYKNQPVSSIELWTSGDLRFDNKTLKEITHVMERRYDISIKLMDEELASEYFTCHFRKDLTITQALELLKSTRRINYSINKRTVYLYKN